MTGRYPQPMPDVQAPPQPQAADAYAAVARKPSPDRDARPVTVVEPSRGWLLSLGLTGLWEYRELLFFLTWRDIKVRYRQTVIGALWAVLQPVLMMLVFGLFFGRLAGLSSEGRPYPVFAFAALVPWTLFSQALRGASESVVKSGALVSKIYFPRLIAPLASAGSFVVDFLLALVVLFGIMGFYGIYPTGRIIWLLPLTIFTLGAALAVGVWLAALNVRYRDVAYVVPFLVQLWLFASPVGYSTTIVPGAWRTLYGLNPMVGIIEGFRWSVVGTTTTPGPIVAVSAAVTLLLLLGGLLYFRHTERTFADVI
jgi:lipopolysaccharide transport system permease protein